MPSIYAFSFSRQYKILIVQMDLEPLTLVNARFSSFSFRLIFHGGRWLLVNFSMMEYKTHPFSDNARFTISGVVSIFLATRAYKLSYLWLSWREVIAMAAAEIEAT